MHWKMFIEGTSDKRFLSSLLSHLNVSGVDMIPPGVVVAADREGEARASAAASAS